MIPTDQHDALYDAYEAELRRQWPALRIIRKCDSTLCTLIDRTLRVLTFGGQSTFLDRYVTTLGHRIYVPDEWDRWPAARRYLVMRHEAVHVGQFRRLTWPLITVLYLFTPLPVGFAAGRAWLEWEGYRETILATWQLFGREAAHDPALADEIVRRYTGPDYAWMWIRGSTVRRAIARLLADLDRNPPPPLTVPEPDPHA